MGLFLRVEVEEKEDGEEEDGFRAAEAATLVGLRLRVAEERDPVESQPALRHFRPAPLPEAAVDSTVLVARGSCWGCNCCWGLSWNGTVAFMGSRRDRRLTPALSPEAPAADPPVTPQPEVGEPVLRSRCDMTTTERAQTTVTGAQRRKQGVKPYREVCQVCFVWRS